ncbi:MAG: M20/M25/M40 family metallo-hydrolase [Verrucomicrobiota bacterium]|nr:M20/M25/M40 family metallo-hydrolase [Verrucomicrobiota bacterium]
MFDPIEAVKEYIRFPSISTDPAYKAGMEGARNHIAGILQRMGCEVEIVPAGLHPLVFAQRKGDPSWPHVIIYGHYDVQPADPIEKWDTPPFEPVVKDGKLFARGAADNKGPQMVHVAAAARLLEKHPNIPLRLSFLIEGEEEIGSPSFPDILKRLRDRLNGDFILLSDNMSPNAEQIAITCGFRGIVCINAEVTGPKSDLHSGIHGGALLNPIQALVDLCASLHTPDGRVNIPGFYDAVIPPVDWERAEVAKLPGTTEDYRQFLDIPAFHTIDGLTPQEATRFMPTLEFNGIGSGYQGTGTKTVIPSKAILKISCRLVANQDTTIIEELVIKTLEERCSKKVSLNIQREHCGSPYRVVPPGRSDTPTDQNKHLVAAFQAADKAITEVYGKPPLYTREGGSVPIISDLKKVTGMDSLMIGMFTPDSNLHAPNENLDLAMFLKGIDMSERILAGVAGVSV